MAKMLLVLSLAALTFVACQDSKELGPMDGPESSRGTHDAASEATGKESQLGSSIASAVQQITIVKVESGKPYETGKRRNLIKKWPPTGLTAAQCPYGKADFAGRLSGGPGKKWFSLDLGGPTLVTEVWTQSANGYGIYTILNPRFKAEVSVCPTKEKGSGCQKCTPSPKLMSNKNKMAIYKQICGGKVGRFVRIDSTISTKVNLHECSYKVMGTTDLKEKWELLNRDCACDKSELIKSNVESPKACQTLLSKFSFGYWDSKGKQCYGAKSCNTCLIAPGKTTFVWSKVYEKAD